MDEMASMTGITWISNKDKDEAYIAGIRTEIVDLHDGSLPQPLPDAAWKNIWASASKDFSDHYGNMFLTGKEHHERLKFFLLKSVLGLIADSAGDATVLNTQKSIAANAVIRRDSAFSYMPTLLRGAINEVCAPDVNDNHVKELWRNIPELNISVFARKYITEIVKESGYDYARVYKILAGGRKTRKSEQETGENRLAWGVLKAVRNKLGKRPGTVKTHYYRNRIKLIINLFLYSLLKGSIDDVIVLSSALAPHGWRTGPFNTMKPLKKKLLKFPEIGTRLEEMARPFTNRAISLLEDLESNILEVPEQIELFKQAYTLIQLSCLFSPNETAGTLRGVEIGPDRHYMLTRAIKRGSHFTLDPEGNQIWINELTQLFYENAIDTQRFAIYEACYFIDRLDIGDWTDILEGARVAFSINQCRREAKAVIGETNKNLKEDQYKTIQMSAINVGRLAVFLKAHQGKNDLLNPKLKKLIRKISQNGWRSYSKAELSKIPPMKESIDPIVDWIKRLIEH